jgi:glycosyltransferase involved in cell wall biosynthesis
MRIAHVVTLVSPDGAFGGPVRVATNLAQAMRDAGHEVTILGAYQGYDAVPTQVDGVRAKLFPARRLLPGLGFAGLACPGLLGYLWRHVDEFDILHVHMARDLVTLPAALLARRARIPYVTQTHGMIDASDRALARILDLAATRRAVRGARTVFHLTAREREDLVGVVGSTSLPLAFLPNGVPTTDQAADVASGREVLYLARLAARKRPLVFVEAAIALRERFPQVRFTLVGPDEGEADAVCARIEAAGAGDVIAWEGPLAPERTLDRMLQASIYVLPSIDEPFPMAVLEAMSVGLPSIVTDTCGLATALNDPTALGVVDSSVDGLVAELGALLADPELRQTRGERARREVADHFSIDRAAMAALAKYEEGCDERTASRLRAGRL